MLVEFFIISNNWQEDNSFEFTFLLLRMFRRLIRCPISFFDLNPLGMSWFLIVSIDCSSSSRSNFESLYQRYGDRRWMASMDIFRFFRSQLHWFSADSILCFSFSSVSFKSSVLLLWSVGSILGHWFQPFWSFSVCYSFDIVLHNVREIWND